VECGAARTLVHRPPDWRIAAAIVATVIVLVLAGFAIALINLSADSNRGAATTVTVTASSTSTVAAPKRRKPAALPGWQTGLPGWTVVFYSAPKRNVAVAKARQLVAAGLHVGVLNTSRHPSGNMAPGRFVVFAGRYPTRQGAQARVKALKARVTAKGYRARVRRVGIPGAR